MLLEFVLFVLASGERSAPPQKSAVHPARLLIQPAPGIAPAALERLHQRLGAHVLRELPAIGWQIVEVDARRLAERRSQYASSVLVARAEFDHARRLAYVPNDPLYLNPPGMWNVGHMHVDTAWDTTRGSSSVLVAVIDTGCERTHADLAANMWVNPGEIPNNAIDDDNDGLVDDVSGWDFVNNDPVPDDVHGHGTACAGIIGAVQDNNLGVTGLAPLCKLLPLKACDDAGYLFDSYVVPALLYAADRGAKVISMSFYGDDVTPAERDAIDYCWAHGALPIAAAGNDSQTFPYYPGAYEHTLGVGSHNSSDQKSSFSNWGSWVDVAAPGEGISTTLPNGGYTTSFAGTSAACPNVAGVAGLLFSARPGVTNAEVRAALEDTAIDLAQPPYGAWANYGRIDAQAALDRILTNAEGSKPARLLFVSPVGGTLAPGPLGYPSTTPDLIAYGVGFEQPNIAHLMLDGVNCPILAQTRNEIRATPVTNTPAKLTLEVNAHTVRSLTWDSAPGWLFAPSDANTRGVGTATGGFLELYRDDGQCFTCTRSSSQSQKIIVQLLIRKVRATPGQHLAIEWTRSYANCIGGTETVEVYDWQSGSYPYGNYVTIHSVAIANANGAQLVAALPGDPLRFLDDEGSVYVRITTTNAAANALLTMDSLRLHVE
jgi:thermitase